MYGRLKYTGNRISLYKRRSAGIKFRQARLYRRANRYTRTLHNWRPSIW